MEFNDLTGSPFYTQILSRCSTHEDNPGPFTNLVDFIKPLQWLPSSKRARAVQLHSDFIEVYGSMIIAVKKRIDAGENVPNCLAKVLIENQEREKLDWEDMCMLSVAFALGGVHSVHIFFKVSAIVR